MPLSSLLRISSSRLALTAAQRSRRAASTVTANGSKSLDSILIANRGEIALYVDPTLSVTDVTCIDCDGKTGREDCGPAWDPSNNTIHRPR